jgi:hypothetical protein
VFAVLGVWVLLVQPVTWRTGTGRGWGVACFLPTVLSFLCIPCCLGCFVARAYLSFLWAPSLCVRLADTAHVNQFVCGAVYVFWLCNLAQVSWLCPLVALFGCALAWMSRHLVALQQGAPKPKNLGFFGGGVLAERLCSLV